MLIVTKAPEVTPLINYLQNPKHSIFFYSAGVLNCHQQLLAPYAPRLHFCPSSLKLRNLTLEWGNITSIATFLDTLKQIALGVTVISRPEELITMELIDLAYASASLEYPTILTFAAQGVLNCAPSSYPFLQKLKASHLYEIKLRAVIKDIKKYNITPLDNIELLEEFESWSQPVIIENIAS